MIKAASVFLLVAAAVATTSAAPQQQSQRGRFIDELDPTTTPKPIVQIKRLINQQNRDGSYTYGFEADDGTFKIETRDNLGNVKGKYGYIDVNNELKIVDYSAGNGTGFDAQADHFPKAPEPVPVPAPRPQEREPPRSSFRAQQPAPQQQSFRGAAPQQAPQPAPSPITNDPSGLSHFNDPNGVFQFSFPSPGQPAAAAPAGSFSEDGQYIGSIALEGFSEDADKDGFVDPVPTDGRVPIRSDRPRRPQQSAPAFQHQQPAGVPSAGPQFASVDFRGVPERQPAFDRPQFQEPARFLPQPQPQPQPQRFFDPSAFAPQQRQPQGFPAFQPQPQPQQFPQFVPQQQPAAPPARFLQNASPVFQGATEPPRFVNPLALQQGRRPF